MTAQQFVTEMTRVIRNTDLDDPVQFAAFRQVAEERIESYAQSKADAQSADRDRTIEELRATISDFDNGHDKYALDAKTALLDRMTEALKLCKPCVEYSMNNPGDNDVGKFMNRHTLLLFTISELLTDYANQKKQ